MRGVEFEHVPLLCRLFARLRGVRVAEAAHALTGGLAAAGDNAGPAVAVDAGAEAGPLADAGGDAAAVERARAAAAHRVVADRRVPAAACRLLRGDRLAPPRDEARRDPVGVRAVLRLDSALSDDKTQPRADEAWRIRALGPAFHALAEINVTGWTAWVATTGKSWYEAGVEARRRMAAAGYDVAAGDTWALNELSSAVRQGIGDARANMRAFLKGLYDGDGVLPSARGAVFVAGIGQATGDLSVYQARLQDWYEDAEFWTDLSRYASDWSQEVYGDVRALRRRRRDAGDAARLAERVPPAHDRARRRRAAAGDAARALPGRDLQPARERGLAVRRRVRLDERPGRADAGLRLGADIRDALGGQQPLRLRLVAAESRRAALRRVQRADRCAARAARGCDRRLGRSPGGRLRLYLVQPAGSTARP